MIAQRHWLITLNMLQQHRSGKIQMCGPVTTTIVGEALLTAQQLPGENLLEYPDLKSAILQLARKGVSELLADGQCATDLWEEQHTEPLMMVFGYAAGQLWDTFCWELLADECGIKVIVVLKGTEQFVPVLQGTWLCPGAVLHDGVVCIGPGSQCTTIVCIWSHTG